MADDWTHTSLGEVIELKRGYDLPKREREPGPVPLVSSSGVTDHQAEAKVKGPGVVTGRYGTLGQVFYQEGDFWPLNTTLYVRDFKGNDPRFISYFLQGLDYLAYSDKAAVPGVNRNHLHQASVSIPPYAEQRAIAHILGTLDDKIELNRRMNETLEAMARTLFKSWFVDFDPVRAKMDGRWQKGESLPGLPAELYDLFPDRLVGSELGEVPEGWRVGPLKRHVHAVRGLSYKGKHLADEGMPMHNLNSVLEGGGYKYEGIKYYEGEHRDRHLLRAGDLVVANTEQGHDRLLIGYAALVPRAFGEEGIFSHHLYRILPKKESALSSAFLCYLLNSGPMQQIVSGYANGTTVNMLPGDALELPKIVVPPEPLVASFSAAAETLLERREELVAESNTLERLRDTLLPRLISGELRVPDAERIVERTPDA